MDVAAAREVPIPVYAEMSSINPVFVLPGALAERGAQIAEGLVGSVSLGVGQFCTSPGLVFAAGEGKDEFVAKVSEGLGAVAPAAMLHQGIANNYSAGLTQMAAQEGVEQVAAVPASGCQAGPAVFRAGVDQFLKNEALSAEVFGPSTLLVDCGSEDDFLAAAESLEGQLTASVHGTDADLEKAGPLLKILAQRAGRLVVNGFPTGVDVCPSMVHGGPYPATSDGSSSSVGTQAISRFTRAVSWQAMPEHLLPAELQSANPLGIWRLVDGSLSKDPV